MRKGYLATLFAAAVSFAGTQAAFAAAPIVSGLPDLTVGDMEDNNGGATDNNFFVYTNAFQFSTHVTDADTTDKSTLLWSFSEYYTTPGTFSDTTQEYTVNGKNPIAIGSSAIATETSGGLVNVKNPGVKRLNGSSDFATFRDILFSRPVQDPGPWSIALTAPQIAAAQNIGKNLVFYAADPEGNVGQDVIIVKTKDQGFDALSATFTPGIDQGGPPNNTAMSGWIESGLNSTGGDQVAQPGGGPNTDDVDRTDNTNAIYATGQGVPSTTATDLGTIVRASSHRTRILGWTNPTGIAYPGAGSYVRGKFYVYTNNAAIDAQNKIPPFRARLQQGGAIVGWLNMSYVGTGNTGGNTGDGSVDYALFNDPTIDTYGAFLKASRNSAKPSLYRVDFDPIDVPAAASRPIVPTFESFAFQDPTAGTIFLAQCTVLTYPALDDTVGTQIMSYSRATTAASQGLTFASGGFLAENNFTPGYRQHLFLSGAGQATGLETAGTFGLVGDTGTANVNAANRFIVGTYDVTVNSNALRPRIQSGKLYRGRYYVTSDVPTTAAASGTERQSTVRVRLQTGGGVLSAYQELPGNNATVYNTSTGPTDNNYKDNVVSGQAIPGINSVNPEFDNTLTPAGYDGGWYTVLMDSPLDVDIRQDAGGTLAAFGTTPGTIGGDPGPGSASASPGRDIKTGFDCYTSPRNLVLGASTFTNYFDANRAKASVTAIKLFEVPQIDDGGYVY